MAMGNALSAHATRLDRTANVNIIQDPKRGRRVMCTFTPQSHLPAIAVHDAPFDGKSRKLAQFAAFCSKCRGCSTSNGDNGWTDGNHLWRFVFIWFLEEPRRDDEPRVCESIPPHSPRPLVARRPALVEFRHIAIILWWVACVLVFFAHRQPNKVYFVWLGCRRGWITTIQLVQIYWYSWAWGELIIVKFTKKNGNKQRLFCKYYFFKANYLHIKLFDIVFSIY